MYERTGCGVYEMRRSKIASLGGVVMQWLTEDHDLACGERVAHDSGSSDACVLVCWSLYVCVSEHKKMRHPSGDV
jgi:hypothetical protein